MNTELLEAARERIRGELLGIAGMARTKEDARQLFLLFDFVAADIVDAEAVVRQACHICIDCRERVPDGAPVFGSLKADESNPAFAVNGKPMDRRCLTCWQTYTMIMEVIRREGKESEDGYLF